MVRIYFYDPDKEEHPLKGTKDVSESARSATPATTAPAWTSQLGWSGNPFKDFPARPASHYFVGHDDARAALMKCASTDHGFVTVTGPLGIGKSILLAWLAEELSSKPKEYRVVAATPAMNAKAFTALLVKPYKGVLSGYSGETHEELAQYLAKKEKRRLVLLIDDAESLGELEPILHALTEVPSIRIVLVGERVHALRPDAPAVGLTPLTLTQAQQLLEARIKGVGGTGYKPFSLHVIAELWKAAQGDPIRFFRYSEETAMRLATGELALDAKPSAADIHASSTTPEHDAKHGTKKGIKNIPTKTGHSAKAGKAEHAGAKHHGKSAKGASSDDAFIQEMSEEGTDSAPLLTEKQPAKPARRTDIDSYISDLVDSPKKK